MWPTQGTSGPQSSTGSRSEGVQPQRCAKGGKQMAKQQQPSHKIGRDAKTGEFIPVKEAERRPSTTVVETIKPAKK